MQHKFQWRSFSDVNLDDPFFDTLKSDYSEFDQWFNKKRAHGDKALVYSDNLGVAAFIYLKEENELIDMVDGPFPAKPRIKIGTFRIAERIRGRRLGEGALGVALWRWQASKRSEIYMTVFDRHRDLMDLFERYGFTKAGTNKKGEQILLRSREAVDYSDPFKSFPFISPFFHVAGMIPIEDRYHDSLFPYSEIMWNKTDYEEVTAGNGVLKAYIGSPSSPIFHKRGDPVFIYRKYTGSDGVPGYKSAITSFCTVTEVSIIKGFDQSSLSLSEYLDLAGNKTVFDNESLRAFYKIKKHLVLIELLYNGYFGEGHNVNFFELKQAGLFEQYPYLIRYSSADFISILKMGDVDVKNVIID
jgi:hypothetical protein